jgi:hypothetical protein
MTKLSLALGMMLLHRAQFEGNVVDKSAVLAKGRTLHENESSRSHSIAYIVRLLTFSGGVSFLKYGIRPS